MPKVSICIPTYNQTKYLAKTLKSIQQQTFIDYELIITDDSNTSQVENLVNHYNFEGKLKYYRNYLQLGSPENWNEAIRKSSGEYIKIMHHDEWFNNQYALNEFVKMLDENRHATFAFSSALAINIESNKTWIHTPSAENLSMLHKEPRCLFFGNFIGPPSSTIYRREINIQFDKNLKWVVDFDFYIATLKSNKNFVFSKNPLITSISGAEHNVTNTCQNKETMIFEYLYLYKKVFKFPLLQHFSFFTSLFREYNIKKNSEVKQICNFTPPLFIKLIILYENIRLPLK